MKVVIVSIEEVKKGNNRLCLNSLRATNRCIACKSYDVCESRRLNKAVHYKRAKLVKKMDKIKEELRKFEKEYMEL